MMKMLLESGDVVEKNYGLNYIRAIGAILVMLYHYTTRYLDVVYNMGAENSHTGVWWGCWAVSIFFILSGFLTVANVKDSLTPKTFAIKRITRLYPTYWIAVILTTVVTYMTNSILKIDLVSTMLNFTMLQGFAGIPNVDGAYWTLRFELWFYVIITFTLFFRKRNYTILSTVWIALILSQNIVFGVLGIDNIIKSISTIFLMSDWASTFIIGMSLYAISKNRKAWLSYVNLILSFVIEYNLRPMNRFFFTVLITLFIYVLIEKKVKIKHDKILNFFAGISFPLYLIHQKIGYVIISYFEKIIGGGMYLGVVAAVCVSISLAYLIHRFVEIPIVHLLKKAKV